MSGSLKRQPGFFKVLIGDFSSQLLIPVEFSRRYKEILPRKLHLQTGSQKSWTVKIEEVDGKHYFMEGWPEFVRGNRLEERDYLVFDYVGKSTFKVVIYAENGCDKGFPSTKNELVVPNRAVLKRGRPIKVEY